MTKQYTPQDYIYKEVLDLLVKGGDLTLSEVVTLDNATNITTFLEDYTDVEYASDYICDAISDYRESGEECNLGSNQYSRHYEVDFVVKKIGDKWVGWDYWYGGGKHGQPESIDWISDAVFVDLVSEKEVVVVERKFERVKEK